MQPTGEKMESLGRPGVVSYILISILTVWIGFFAGAFGFVAPAFVEVFGAMGEASIPSLSQLVIVDASPLVWRLLIRGFLVLLGLFIFLLVKKTFLARRLTLAAIGVNIAGQLVVFAALYAPVLKIHGYID
jgi:type II secretory pathway component PulF